MVYTVGEMAKKLDTQHVEANMIHSNSLSAK